MQRMNFPEFLGMMRAHYLLNKYFTNREAALAFSWSRMHVIHDLEHRGKAVGLSFIDFLEALCRSAEFICSARCDRAASSTTHGGS
jgi:hypothetical protein